MQAAIIPSDTAQPIRFEDIDPAADLHRLVDGDFQVVGLHGLSVNMYLNENGKLEGLGANPRATALCHRYGAIRTDDYIVGDAILLGPVDDGGDDTSLDSYQQGLLGDFDDEFGRHLR